VAKMPPYLRAILWLLRSEGPVIAFEGKPVKSRLGRRGGHGTGPGWMLT
jgi:hypothetical protein